MDDLPNELSVGVLHYLDANELRIGKNVNQHWHNLIEYHHIMFVSAVQVIECCRKRQMQERERLVRSPLWGRYWAKKFGGKFVDKVADKLDAEWNKKFKDFCFT